MKDAGYLFMGGQSLFDPNREIEPEAPQSEDKRVGVFVLLVLALVVALVVALVAYYFIVLRPFMVIEKAPAQTGLSAPRSHLLAQD
jgi:heme/copper-type cytochrome/quinol oxidase subunit 2